MYRTADNQWVGLFAGNVLQWLPSAALSGKYELLPAVPTRIERVTPNRSLDGVSMTPGYPSLLRAGPSFDAAIVGNIDQDTLWKVLGRSADEQWVQIEVNGQKVWINGGLACLMNGELDDLPVVG